MPFFSVFFFCCSPRLGHGPQSYLRLPLTVGNLRSQSTPFLFKIIWINLMACSNPQTYQHPQGWSWGCRGGTLSIAFSVSEIVDPQNKKGQAMTLPILIKFRKDYRYKGSYKCIDTDTRGNLTSFHASFHYSPIRSIASNNSKPCRSDAVRSRNPSHFFPGWSLGSSSKNEISIGWPMPPSLSSRPFSFNELTRIKS